MGFKEEIRWVKGKGRGRKEGDQKMEPLERERKG